MFHLTTLIFIWNKHLDVTMEERGNIATSLDETQIGSRVHNNKVQRQLRRLPADVGLSHDNTRMRAIQNIKMAMLHKNCWELERRTFSLSQHVCVSYLEGESVLTGTEPHVLHGGAADHHLSHISAGHKCWAAGLTEEDRQCD